MVDSVKNKTAIPSLNASHPYNWRDDFPIFSETMNGKALIYLDSAASAQKPQMVIDAITDHYKYGYANIHRGLYRYSQDMTASFETARARVAEFIGARSPRNIIFTSGATAAINLVAHSWGSAFLQAGDEIILTEMEHHANIVPWQLIAQKTGALIRSVPITKEGTLDLTALPSLLNDRTKIVAFVHISNALGTVNPVDTIIKQVRDFNPEIKILIDGTQAVVHQKIDVTVMDVDFYAFTGHKLYAATGIGVLYGKEDLLNSMPPYQGGGDMIETVRMDSSDFKKAPARFEAGTPPFIEAISLHHALDYLDTIGMDSIMAHEKDILSYGYTRLKNIHGLTIHGTVDLQQRAAILPFTIDWAHPSDVAMILDQCGVAVRVGHHCCQPLMAAMGVSATLRVSLGLYNTTNDIDILIQSIHKAKEMLG